jgi:hypothetical protein
MAINNPLGSEAENGKLNPDLSKRSLFHFRPPTSAKWIYDLYEICFEELFRKPFENTPTLDNGFSSFAKGL